MKPFYNKDGDLIQYYANNKEHYAEWVDHALTLYREQDSGAVCGVEIHRVKHIDGIEEMKPREEQRDGNNLRLELDEAKSEAKYWKSVAILLADYHAANYSIAITKSTAKFQRSRLMTIMRRCKEYLLKEKCPPTFTTSIRGRKEVADRIENSVRLLETEHPELREVE